MFKNRWSKRLYFVIPNLFQNQNQNQNPPLCHSELVSESELVLVTIYKKRKRSIPLGIGAKKLGKNPKILFWIQLLRDAKRA